MKKLLDILTQAALLVFFPLAFLRLAFFGLAFLLLSGCGEVINVYTTSAKKPALELEVGSGGEWTEAIAFTATLAEATTKDITFSYATELDGTAGEEDLVSVAGKATIPAGETEVSVIVQIIDDYQDDNDETFSFVLSKANTKLINDEKSITAIATILDDDYSYTPLQLVQFDDVSIKEGDGYTVNRMTFKVILNRGVLAHENVSFDYIVIGETAQDNEDYISIVGTADISYSDRTSLSVSIVGDYVEEARLETFRLILSNPVGFEITPEVDGVAVGTIIDNDKLILESFMNSFKVEGNANSNMGFDLLLSRPVNGEETVSLNYVVIQGTATAGSDYIDIGETTLSFGVSKDRATIAVEIIGDTVDEDDYKTFTVKLSNLVGLERAPEIDLVARGIIQDDDSSLGILKDTDSNGLIDIYNANMLNNIRYNLAGTSYKTSEGATGVTAGCPSSGCFGYELLDDIFLPPPISWVPVGITAILGSIFFPPPPTWVTVGDSANPFTATLEGNGFTINNLNIVSNQNEIGFFARLAGTVQNLNFAAGSVTSKYDGSKTNSGRVGSLAARMLAGALVNNVSSAVSVSSNSTTCEYVGGLVGQSKGLIMDSSATGNVDNKRNGNNCLSSTFSSVNGAVGGLVGYNDPSGKIEDSYAAGNIVSGGGSHAIGGLVGVNIGKLINSYAAGSITSYNTYGLAGGLVGENGGLIEKCHTKGVIAGTKAGDVRGYGIILAGGLVGKNNTTILDSYATGNTYITGSYGDVGGLVGYNFSGKIKGSYAMGNVYGGFGLDDAGGLVGYNYNGKIEKSYATGNVYGSEGSDYVGGLVGKLKGWIEESFATGNVYGGNALKPDSLRISPHNDDVGGLVGRFSRGVIKKSYATGAVDGKGGNDHVGGLVGIAFGRVISSYASGNVAGGNHEDFVGGLVGFTYNSVSGSYAIGTVDGDNGNDRVGGLAGYSTYKIINSFAAGIVSGSNGNDRVGGLIGEKDTGSIRNSYAIGAVNGNLGADYVGGIVGKINRGSLKNSYAIGAVDGGAGTNDKIGFLTGFKGASADIAGNYYLMGSGLTNGTALSLATTEAIGKSKANLKALTIATTGNDFTEGWSNLDWNLTANDLYPSLKSYKAENDIQVEGDIICGQSSEHVQC